MKVFLLSAQNIRSVIGEVNKTLSRNGSLGHYVFKKPFVRKNNKRPIATYPNEKSIKHFECSVKEIRGENLCEFVQANKEYSNDFPSFLCSNDTVIIDGVNIHLILRGRRTISSKDLNVSKIGRISYSFMPATS